MQRFQRLRTAAGDESGAVLIEMAAVVPVIMLIGLGVLEFANFFYNYQLIQNGVRDAARFAASMPYPPSSTLPSEVQNLAITGVPSGGTARVAWWASTDVSVTYSTVPNPCSKMVCGPIDMRGTCLWWRSQHRSPIHPSASSAF